MANSSTDAGEKLSPAVAAASSARTSAAGEIRQRNAEAREQMPHEKITGVEQRCVKRLEDVQ